MSFLRVCKIPLMGHYQGPAFKCRVVKEPKILLPCGISLSCMSGVDSVAPCCPMKFIVVEHNARRVETHLACRLLKRHCLLLHFKRICLRGRMAICCVDGWSVSPAVLTAPTVRS